MPTASTHFAIGALGGSFLTLLLLFFRTARKKLKLILFYAPLFSSFCGVLSMMPDILTAALTPQFTKQDFHQPLLNIFFMHIWLDHWENTLPADQALFLSYVLMGGAFLLYNAFIFFYIFYIIQLKKKYVSVRIQDQSR